MTEAAAPAAAHATVHVYHIRLDVAWERAVQWLDEGERARAARLRFADHRRRYIVAHAALRMILAPCVGIEARALRFERGRHGKPGLTGAPGCAVGFNLSHSHELALVAVAPGRHVGIDVEHLDARHDTPGLVQRFFSTRERDALAALPAADAMRGFFDCWVRKEAYLKARGDGLWRGLHGFSVSVGAHDDPVGVLDEEHPDPDSQWWMRPLQVAAGYAAAVVASGGLFDVEYRVFLPPDDGLGS